MFAASLLLLAASTLDIVVDEQSCVSSAAVVAGVTARVPADSVGRAHVEVDAAQRTAVVHLGDDGERRLAATDCAQLTEQTIFVIALWLDPRLLLAKPPAPTTTPEPPPTTQDPPAPTPDPSPPLRLAVAAGASTLWMAPRFAVQLAQGDTLRWRAGVDVEVAVARHAGPVELSIIAPQARGDVCVGDVVSGCIGAGAGVVVGVPHAGVRDPQIAVLPLVTGEARLAAHGSLFDSNDLFVEVGVTVPLIPIALTAGTLDIATAPPLAVNGLAGVSFDLP